MKPTRPFKEEVLSDPAQHRKLGVDLFNYVWTLLEKPDRTKDEDEEMVHAAHASRWHWSIAGAPVNFARGEWQISRVYAVLGRGEAALRHALRSLEICEANGIGDFDLAYAYEAIARAWSVLGSAEETSRYMALARDATARVAEADDRELLLKDLETMPGVISLGGPPPRSTPAP